MITNFTLTCSDCLFAISSDVSFSKNSNEIDIEKNPKLSWDEINDTLKVSDDSKDQTKETIIVHQTLPCKIGI